MPMFTKIPQPLAPARGGSPLTARICLLLVSALGFGAALAGEAQEPPTVRVVRFERIGGGVERPNEEPVAHMLGPMPPQAWEVKDGVYRSVISRISLRVPRLSDEKLVDVREAVALVRADGSPATTHIMFDPDGTKFANGPAAAQSTVVVTRLRDDRAKEAESVLARLDGGEAQRAKLTADLGVSYARLETNLGPALRRVVRNRAYSQRFPYDLAVLRDSMTTTYGITTSVIAGTDSLLEFSQLFPCGQRSDAECHAAALKAHEAFVVGVTEFRTLPPTGGSPTPPAR